MGEVEHLRGIQPEAGGGSEDERREYLRVPARLRIRERVIESDEICALRHEIEMQPHLQNSGIDPGLLAHLERIEFKLDRILARVDPTLRQPIAALEPRDVEISGAGIRIATTRDGPADGARLLVEFLLPDSSTPVRAIGTVRSHVEGGGPQKHSEIAIAFDVMHDADRQAIVRFVLEMERCAVRDRAQEDT
jgi:hypothetical protein